MKPFKPDQTFAADIALAVRQSVNLPHLRTVVGRHVAVAVADPRVQQARRVLMGGSGDSWFAALSAAPAWQRWTGLATEARPAIELARYNITVNAVCPGFVETEMWRSVPPNIQEKILDRIPMHRVAKPEEIARGVRFLAVEGDYMTGQSLNINGGIYMGW